MADIRSLTQAATNGTQLDLVRPAGTVAGDVLVALVASGNDLVNFPPSGWSRVDNGAGSHLSAWVKLAGASEPSFYRWGWNTASGRTGVLLALEGVASATPEVDSYAASATAPSITTLGANRLLIGASKASFTLPGTPTGMTSVATETGASQYLRVAEEDIATAGATGSRAFTSGAYSALLAFEPDNAAPNAPVLTAPIGGATVDRTANVDLEGTFSDPDAGDQLSAYEVEYRLQAGGGLVQPGEISASGTTFAYTITGGTLSAGGWEWRARTRDAAGALGSWSSWEQFTAASPPAAPVITDPADAGTVNTDPYTVAWTSPAQDAYQVRTVADNAGAPNTAIVYEDTGTVESTSARAASIDFTTNSRTEHVQVRIRLGGLWSAWDSHIVSVSYTVPPTPTVVVTPGDGTDTAGGYISVAISNPTPVGDEPAITGNDLRRQQSSDGGTTWTDEALIPDLFNRVAAGVAEDGTYEDYLVGDQRRWTYRYQSVALGDNGTRAAGAWTT